jgi:hypothetical protein
MPLRIMQRGLKPYVLRQFDKNDACRQDLQGFETLSIHHRLDIPFTDDGEVVILAHRRPIRQEHFYFCLWYSFLLGLKG